MDKIQQKLLYEIPQINIILKSKTEVIFKNCSLYITYHISLIKD